ncbi:hypothetical protein M1N00_03760 [Thermodesulfovibrionales bacterium]|nr:hypothetical protein [Thermodesulfovibrionales bacterium]
MERNVGKRKMTIDEQRLYFWRKCSFIVSIGLFIITFFLLHVDHILLEKSIYWPCFHNVLPILIITSVFSALLFWFLWAALSLIVMIKRQNHQEFKKMSLKKRIALEIGENTWALCYGLGMCSLIGGISKIFFPDLLYAPNVPPSGGIIGGVIFIVLGIFLIFQGLRKH